MGRKKMGQGRESEEGATGEQDHSPSPQAEDTRQEEKEKKEKKREKKEKKAKKGKGGGTEDEGEESSKGDEAVVAMEESKKAKKEKKSLKRPREAGAAEEQSQVEGAGEGGESQEEEEEEGGGGKEAEGGGEEGGEAEGKKKRKRKRKRKGASTDGKEGEAGADGGSCASGGNSDNKTTTPLAPVPSSEPLEVYIEGIPYSANEDDMAAFFAPVGKVVEVRMPRYQDSGKPRGYGHVVFETVEGAKRAFELDGKDCRGRYITVRKAQAAKALQTQASNMKLTAPGGCKTVFVKNLPYTTNEDAVSQIFRVFGKIANVRLAKWNHTNTLKGFGYVDFVAESGAALAVKKQADIKVGGRPIVVDFEVEGPKNSFRAQDGKLWGKTHRPTR